MYYGGGRCDVLSRTLFWTEALSPLAARSAGLSQLMAASLFGSCGLQGAASTKVTLSPAGGGQECSLHSVTGQCRGSKAWTTPLNLEQL